MFFSNIKQQYLKSLFFLYSHVVKKSYDLSDELRQERDTFEELIEQERLNNIQDPIDTLIQYSGQLGSVGQMSHDESQSFSGQSSFAYGSGSVAIGYNTYNGFTGTSSYPSVSGTYFLGVDLASQNSIPQIIINDKIEENTPIFNKIDRLDSIE